jgi:predicted aldo/keto reductase-like oxidoreductase
MEETCGKDWAEKGLLNLPTCYEECTSGIAIGHILWLHNLLTSYGMYDFCKDRYKMLEGNTLNPKKPFHVQVKW